MWFFLLLKYLFWGKVRQVRIFFFVVIWVLCEICFFVVIVSIFFWFLFYFRFVFGVCLLVFFVC